MTALVFDTATSVANKTNPAANIPVDWCEGRILADTRATREIRFAAPFELLAKGRRAAEPYPIQFRSSSCLQSLKKGIVDGIILNPQGAAWAKGPLWKDQWEVAGNSANQ